MCEPDAKLCKLKTALDIVAEINIWQLGARKYQRKLLQIKIILTINDLKKWTIEHKK
jgi:hypothetical protein